MKGYALALTLAGLSITGVSMSAEAPSTYTGIIHDHAAQSATSATQCPVIKGPRYTLQTGDAAWVLPDEQVVAQYAGKRVSLRARVVDGNKLKVIAIAPVK